MWLIKCIFTTVLLIMLSGCAKCAELNIANNSAAYWASDLVANCMSLTGEYLSVGDAGIPNEINIKSPRFERVVFGVEKFGLAVNSIFLEQLPELNLRIILKSVSGDVLFVQDFERPRLCNGSWLISESKIKGGGDGSSVLETHTITKMARSKDGALVVFVHVDTISRNWFFMKRSRGVDVWYRFSPNVMRENN